MTVAPCYEVRNLHKTYRSPPVVANNGITFTVEQGEAFGLLGPNGAGKSTLVKQLVGLLAPSGGEIRLFDAPLLPGSRAVRDIGRSVAYLPQGALTLGELKVAEAITWTGMLRGVPAKAATAQTEELLATLELSTLAGRQVRKLSGGQRRLTQIGMTLAGDLPVVILDEPTADIDPSLRLRIWDLISARVKEGAAVILVTHDVAEAERALDRVAILSRGRVAAIGTPAELKAGLAHRTRLEIVVAEQATLDVASLATDISFDARVNGRRVSAWVPADEAIPTLEKAMVKAGPGALEDVRLITPTLEDVYLELGERAVAGDVSA